MPTRREEEAARKEQSARERGRSIPHYSKKVAKQLATPARKGKVAPSKKARD